MSGICGFYSCLPQDNAHALSHNMLGKLREVDRCIASEWVDEHGYFGLAQARSLRARVSQSANLHVRQLTAVMDGELEYMDQLYCELRSRSRIYLDDHAAVMLACFANKGMEGLLELSGRFTAAVLDLREQSMTLVNPKSNKQPVYYACTSNCFLFGSCSPSVLAGATFAKDAHSNSQYHGGCTNSDDIKVLSPGNTLVFDVRQNNVVINTWIDAQIA